MADEAQPATVRWTNVPNFEVQVLKDKYFTVDYKQPAAAPEFDFVPDELIAIGEQRGMTYTDDREQAHYVVCAAVRYFDPSPTSDQARTVLDADPKIEAGISGWIADDGSDVNLRRSIAPIDPRAHEGNGSAPRTSREWVVVIDVAIGERVSVREASALASTDPTKFVRNEARLYGYVASAALDRAKAAEQLTPGIKANVGAVFPWARTAKKADKPAEHPAPANTDEAVAATDDPSMNLR